MNIDPRAKTSGILCVDTLEGYQHQSSPTSSIMSYDIEEHVTDKYEIRKRIGKGVRKC